MFGETNDWITLASIRTIDLSEPTELYYHLAKNLIDLNIPDCISRGNFILQQLNGLPGTEIFNSCREEWGIRNFKDDLVSVDDFKRGFLCRFRDHTTSWGDNQKAKLWFLSSPEARFVRRYEFWTCDNGFNECIDVKKGSYKEILQSLLADGDYEVLISPAFSKTELINFREKCESGICDNNIEDIITESIENNPNFQD